MDKRILITGSEGFIGSHFKKALPDADCFDLKTGHDIRSFLPDEDYTHILHLAALKSVPLSDKIPRDFIETNCWGTMNLAMNYPDARFINISSSSADEYLSVYGLTKKFTELIHKYHNNYLSIRLFNVFGEGQLPASGALIPNIIVSKQREEPVKIYGDGSVKRDFTYVGDVVIDVLDLMYGNNVGIIDCGYAQPISVLQMLKIITGNMHVELLPARLREIQYSCSSRPIKKCYGREEGLRRTEKWIKDTLGR